MSDSFASPTREAFRGFGGRHDAARPARQRILQLARPGEPELGRRGQAHRPGARDRSRRTCTPTATRRRTTPQSSFVSSAGYGFLLDRDELSHWRLACRPPGRLAGARPRRPRLDYVVAPGGARRAIRDAHRHHRAPPRAAGLGARARASTARSSSRSTRPTSTPREVAPGPARLRPLPAAARRLPDRGLAVPAARRAARAHPRLRRRRHPPAALLPRVRGQRRDRHRRPRGLRRGAAQRATSRTRADGSPVRLHDQLRQRRARSSTSPTRRRCAGGSAASARRSSSAPTASCRTSASRCRPTCASTTARPARRCTTACRCCSTARRGELVDAYERAHPGRRIFFFTRAGLHAARPGAAAYENANFPGDETTDWSHSAGLASLTHGHAQPRDRRRVRLHDRHRRLLRRRAVRARRARSCSCAGPSGRRCRRSSGCTARCSPARTRRGATTPRRSPLQRALAPAPPRRAADPAAVAPRAHGPGSRSTRPLWLAQPGSAARARRTRSGCWDPTCSSRRSWRRAPAPARCTSRAAAGGAPAVRGATAARVRACGRAARTAALLRPLRHPAAGRLAALRPPGRRARRRPPAQRPPRCPGRG